VVTAQQAARPPPRAPAPDDTTTASTKENTVMIKPLEMTIPRRMSPPARIALVPEHLPPHVRDGLTRLQGAVGRYQAAETAFADAEPAGKRQAKADADAAKADVDQVLYDLATLTAASTTALRDSGVAAFTAAMGRVSRSVRDALAALAEAQLAADMVASTHPGKQMLRLDTRAAAEAPIRQKFSMTRDALKKVLPGLPDGLD
jgi:hypothetical protein